MRVNFDYLFQGRAAMPFEKIAFARHFKAQSAASFQFTKYLTLQDFNFLKGSLPRHNVANGSLSSTIQTTRYDVRRFLWQTV